MDTLQNMRVFVRVVEAGSFTGAAQHLNTTTAYASRAVSDLEAHLRTRLLNRTTRRIALTEAGERYLQRCEQILAYVDQAEAEAGDAHARPSGKLKVHAMTSFGQHYVVPAVGQYQQMYPDVQVELTLAQRMPDLLDEGYDVALVLATDLPDSGFVSQRLTSAFSIACASPAYLERRGVPQKPADLVNHTCLQLVTPVFPVSQWQFSGPNGNETIDLGAAPTFQVNVAEALAVAVSEGMGVGLLPIYSAISGLRSGELVWILPEYTSQEMNVYAMYPSRQYLDAKIRTWVELLREKLPTTLAEDQAELRRFART
ncbi:MULTISPECIES: LysR family transcriptional regulator [Paraburkholderia]|uniref:LysR family transcriptional regulator n=1 Tax=Paraburkholderia tropica TaxID=92647 RepID=A0A1A5X0A0_9BURK|nr:MULTISPECIES: LysR family transcriptional regulator [Paraburkholderia]MBB2984721.1 DNA-binding transcriptional LysR family regulator [Paraburkholderia tropica]MBB3004651.1 DNA-binding transcriptional LysR family regulator [Paraburkholderia tropica]MBB6323751.1 DNA-binding transcriptional LysR family regulator [Paraburkholderia tropica]MDE1141541.1 LysR family transcriptional regulator [Paraburkholderia tropica]OBR46488.1 LysR family transcriptional regulator [Paraburkholderia tropica]